MNLLLLRDEDFLDDETVRLQGRRAQHAREVLRTMAGDTLRVGRLRGNVGTGEVLHVDPEEVRLNVSLHHPPPGRAGVDLLLAIPRPKALKKVLPAVASLGVDRVFLVNAARVEKSYFDSKVLDATFIDELFALGLEQAKDTVPPELVVRERFRPFIEDELPGLLAACPYRWLAHPVGARAPEALPRPGADRVALAIGPEGGWVPFEVELLEKQGFSAFSPGARILRVEVAVPLLLGQIQLLRGLQ